MDCCSRKSIANDDRQIDLVQFAGRFGYSRARRFCELSAELWRPKVRVSVKGQRVARQDVATQLGDRLTDLLDIQGDMHRVFGSSVGGLKVQARARCQTRTASTQADSGVGVMAKYQFSGVIRRKEVGAHEDVGGSKP
jgi:hypothetical protein